MLINQEIGSMQTWRFGLVNREVQRITEELFIIHDLSSGWQTATVNRKVMGELIKGEESLLNLEWE
jgi:hypothetical protein